MWICNTTPNYEIINGGRLAIDVGSEVVNNSRAKRVAKIWTTWYFQQWGGALIALQLQTGILRPVSLVIMNESLMRAYLGTYHAEFYYGNSRPHKCQTVSTSAENGPAMAGPAGPVPAPMSPMMCIFSIFSPLFSFYFLLPDCLSISRPYTAIEIACSHFASCMQRVRNKATCCLLTWKRFEIDWQQQCSSHILYVIHKPPDEHKSLWNVRIMFGRRKCTLSILLLGHPNLLELLSTNKLYN